MSARGLLHNGDYLKLLIGQTVSGFGSAMSSFVFVLIAMSITGSPAKAGLVGTAYIGRIVPVAVDAVSYFVMTVLLATIRKPLPPAQPAGEAPEPMLRAIRSGLAWLVRQPALLTIALVATGINFAALGTLLVLVLDLQQAGTPASIIGLLETGMGVGGIVGSIVAPKLLDRFGTGRLAITSSWITAFTFTATAFTRQPAVLIVLLFTALLLLPAFNSGLFGYQMLITPDNFQGRAQSAIGFLATSTNPLAPLLAGVLLTAAGARPTLLFFGALLALCAVALTVSRSIRAIPLLSEVQPVAAA
ncbi:MFS transporter [Kribbella sp. NPDC054772]